MPTREYYNDRYWSRFVSGFNIGHVLILLGMLSTAIWWFVNYDRELTVTKLTVYNQTTIIEQLVKRVDNIDEHGTHFSQSNIANEIRSIADNLDRTKQLETYNATLLPRIERMDVNIQSINEWVKEQKVLKGNSPK